MKICAYMDIGGEKKKKKCVPKKRLTFMFIKRDSSL